MLKRAHWVWAAVTASVLPGGVAPLLSGGCQSTCATSSDCGSGSYCSTAAGICLSAQAVGFCQPIPGTCPDVVMPVCGCDGKQYQNTCFAAQARVSVSANSTCSVTCGGPAMLTCSDKQTYCHYADGVCGFGNVAGTCDAVPDDCSTATPGAVCGCDNQTYGSRCDAQKAGVSVLSTGACPCGGADNTSCKPSTYYCQIPTGSCTTPSPLGTCVEIPSATECTSFSTPVCGCDSKTYPNACQAALAKQSIAAMGACPCGGPGGVTCQANEFCSYSGVITGNCLDPGILGVCQARPTSCASVNTPVCGCDGQTYTNPCEAAMAGTSVALAMPCSSAADAGTDGG